MIFNFRNWVLQNFPFLEDDFDALTDYELFCKMMEYVLQFAKNEEEFREELDSYKNYFDNLDVQEEINNKLDEMARDGSLTNLIKNYVDPLFIHYTNEINTEFTLYKNNINEQINNQNSNISNLSQNQTVLSERMDEFSSLSEGSTTGDAELIDGRISFDSITYSNIGSNIRNSDSKINARLNDYVNSNILKNMSYVTGSLDPNGNVNSHGTDYITTSYIIDITENTDYYFDNVRYILWYHDNTILSIENIASQFAHDLIIKSPATANRCRMTFALSKRNKITMNKIENELTEFGSEKIKNAIGRHNNLIYGQTPNNGYFSNGNPNTSESSLATYKYYSLIKVKANHTYTVYPRVRFVCLYENYYTRTLVGNLEINASASAGPQSFTPNVDGYVYVTVYKTDYDNGLCKMVDTTTNENEYPVDARIVVDTFIPNEETIDYIKSKLIGELAGKVIYNFGDSIAHGSGNNGVGYARYMANLYGCVVNDYSIDGATLSKIQNQTMSSVQDQIDNASSVAPDIILLEGCCNDYTQARLMGEITNEFTFNNSLYDVTTFTGALEQAFDKLVTKYPGVPIIWIYPHRENTRTQKTVDDVTVNFTTMHDKSIETCKKWAIPVVDIYNESGLNTLIPYYRTTYTNNADGTHPNSYGYLQFYVPYIKAKIKEVLNIN